MPKGGANRIEYTSRHLKVLERELRAGTTRDRAALLADLSPRTLENHVLAGRKNPKGPYGELARRCDLATAQCLAPLERQVSKSKDDRTALEVLARRDPKHWHPVLKVEIERTAEEALAAIEGAAAEVIADAGLRAKLLDAVARRLAAGAEGAAVASGSGAAGSTEG